MSVNMSHAIDPKRTRRFGKLFNTIDFELYEDLTPDIIKTRKGDTTIGEFKIDGKSFPVTLEEICRIEETLATAKSVFLKSYKMGRYGT